MKPVKWILVGLLFATAAASPAMAGEETTYVIPVKGMIERGLLYVMRRGITKAIDEGAGAIVLDMDTPGGRLDAAEEIVNLVAGAEVPTYTYANPNAISAGAIISLATDHIYMAPGSRIGDAMPLMMGPMGGAKEMGEGLEEKAVSYVSGLVRATAQRKNHDPMVAEAMVRRKLEYKIGDEVISKEGELLTLTNLEAERMVGSKKERRRLLSEGTADSLDDLLAMIGRADSNVVTLESSTAERIARYIEMFSALFLIGGLLGIYIEFKTPGFGLPGIGGMVLLAIWFWGHHIAGLAGMGEAIIFMIGAILLLVEILLIPGFGITGTLGLGMMVAALAMAMVQHYPGGSWWKPPEVQIEHAVKVLAASFAGSTLLMVLLARILPNTPVFRHIILKAKTDRAAGYAADHVPEGLVGHKGKPETDLRPAGIATIDGKRMSVVARGAFIDAGTPIVVAEERGNRIVVDVEFT